MEDYSDTSEVVFVFPGQGSHYYQMGRELYDHESVFRKEIDEIDQWFTKNEGYSLVDVLYGQNTISVPFDDIMYSHPAIVMVEYALAMTLYRYGIKPHSVLGFSVGEYSAHAFAGKISIQKALEMTAKQAILAKNSIEDSFLMAVLGPRIVFDESKEIQKLACLAGISFSGAIVLAGLRRNLDALVNILNLKSIAYQVLPVRIPFHTQYLDKIRYPWLTSYKNVKGKTEWLPIVSEFYQYHDQVYIEQLWNTVRKPVDFPSLIKRYPDNKPISFLDVGPSGTIANWIKHGFGYIDNWRSASILSPLGNDLHRFEEIIVNMTEVMAKPIRNVNYDKYRHN